MSLRTIIFICIFLVSLSVATYYSLHKNTNSKRSEDSISSVSNEISTTTFVIVAAGDSLTAGLGLPLEDAYPNQLEKYLNTLGFDVKVINSGISGETSKGLLERVDFIKSFHPDLVIVTTGGNDLLRQLPVNEMEKNISSVVSSIQKSGSTVILSGIEAPKSINEDYRNNFNSVYSHVRDIYKTPFIKNFLSGLSGVDGMIQKDGLHPTKEGYSYIVKNNIAPIIIPLLSNGR